MVTTLKKQNCPKAGDLQCISAHDGLVNCATGLLPLTSSDRVFWTGFHQRCWNPLDDKASVELIQDFPPCLFPFLYHRLAIF